MPNKNYVKGRRKEYKIVKELKNQGYEIAQRTAGSKSPIDIFAINKNTNKILFIQAKPDNYELSREKKLYEDLKWLNKGEFDVKFEVR